MINSALKFLLLAALAGCTSAQAAVSCTVNATNVANTTAYTSGANSDVTGTISGSCTDSTGSRSYVYIGVNQGSSGNRHMTSGSNSLTYEIYHKNAGTGIWNETTGVANTSNSAGGVSWRLGAGMMAQAYSYSYYFRIPSGQTSAYSGVYNDATVTVTVRLSDAAGSANGAVLATTTFSVGGTITTSCSFSTAPGNLTMNYTSFAGSAASGTSNFQITCTNGSPYALSLDNVPLPSVTVVNGTKLGLNYSLTLSSSGAVGTGAAQSYSVSGSIASGQSGTCSSATCNDTTAHTVYIYY